jgi:hypothetical protein
MSRNTSLIHPTYRHLDRAIRLAGLTPVQWLQLIGAGAAAWLLAHVLPFGSTYDLSIAVTVAGAPVAASLAAGAGSAHPLAELRARFRARRRARRYEPADPAAGTTAAGYRLTDDS